MSTKTERPMPPTPELDKLRSVSDRSQEVGRFLDWLTGEKGWHFAKRHVHTQDCYETTTRRGVFPDYKYREVQELSCGMNEDDSFPVHEPPEKLLAAFYEIDLDKIEEERCALLDWHRTVIEKKQ